MLPLPLVDKRRFQKPARRQSLEHFAYRQDTMVQGVGYSYVCIGQGLGYVDRWWMAAKDDTAPTGRRLRPGGLVKRTLRLYSGAFGRYEYLDRGLVAPDHGRIAHPGGDRL